MSTFGAPTRQKARPGLSITPAPSRILRRKCACGGTPGFSGECDECRKKRLQRFAVSESEVPAVPPIVGEVLQQSGRPLDGNARSLMETRIGHDFSHVRIHTDAKAAASARAINATAYTSNQNVVFGSEHYQPENLEGQRLLAHELTHVVQQGRTNDIGLLPTFRLDNNDAHEREAEQIARDVTDNRPSPRRGIRGHSAIRNSVSETKIQRSVVRIGPSRSAPDDPTSREAARQIEAIRDITVLPGLGRKLYARLIMNELAEADAALRAYRGTIDAGSTVLLPVIGYTNIGPPTTAGTTSTTTTALGPGAIVGVGVSVIIGLSNWLVNSLSNRSVSNAEAAKRLSVALDHLAITAQQIPPTFFPKPQPQPQLRDNRRDRNNCLEQNPGAQICMEPPLDSVDQRDEAVSHFIDGQHRAGRHLTFEDVGDSYRVGEAIPSGVIDDCGLAPAIRFHYRINGIRDEVSIFGCLCCDRDGRARYQWSRPHWSENMSRRRR